MTHQRTGKLETLTEAERAAIKSRIAPVTDQPTAEVKAAAKALAVSPMTLLCAAMGLPIRPSTAALIRAGLNRSTGSCNDA